MKKIALAILIIFTGLFVLSTNIGAKQPTAPVQAVQTVKQYDIPKVEKPTPQRLLELTNAERAKVGVKPLIIDDRLNQSAQKKVDELFAEGWDDTPHINKNGLNTAYYAEQFMAGCIYYSENLLNNAYDVNIGMSTWMNSPSHRDAILNARYEYVGFAVKSGYVAQHFCDLN